MGKIINFKDYFSTSQETNTNLLTMVPMFEHPKLGDEFYCDVCKEFSWPMIHFQLGEEIVGDTSATRQDFFVCYRCLNAMKDKKQGFVWDWNLKEQKGNFYIFDIVNNKEGEDDEHKQ